MIVFLSNLPNVLGISVCLAVLKIDYNKRKQIGHQNTTGVCMSMLRPEKVYFFVPQYQYRQQN